MSEELSILWSDANIELNNGISSTIWRISKIWKVCDFCFIAFDYNLFFPLILNRSKGLI